MSWYGESKRSKKRKITISDGGFEWIEDNNIDDSYNIVTIKANNQTHNFYLWSSKTVQSSKNLYASKDYLKSLKMLKKYSFDISTNNDEGDNDDG